MNITEGEFEGMRKLIGRCPLCHLGLDGHVLVTMASVTLGREDSMAEVKETERSFANSNWAELVQHKGDYDPDEDFVLFDLLKCPFHAEAVMYEMLLTGWLGNPEVWKQATLRTETVREIEPFLEGKEGILFAPSARKS